MTLWVFGDSFSRYFKSQPDTWVARTASVLGHNVKAYSRPVEPMEHLFYKFNENRNNFKEGDVIIFTLTNLDRRWFWRDQIFKVYYEYSEEETSSVEQYQKYLNHFDELHLVYLTNFLYNLHTITKKLGIHTIVIANFMDYDRYFEGIHKKFPLFYFGQGTMGEASGKEWKRDLLSEINANMVWLERKDKRLNHFTRSNHILISDKIIDNVKNKTPINFREGLKFDFLDYELEEDPEFCKIELFNDEWKTTVYSDDWKREEE